MSGPYFACDNRKANTYIKEQDHKVVHHLNTQQQFTAKRVTGSENVVPMGERMNTRKKGSIQPATTLRNEFRDLIRDICLSFGRLDVLEVPLLFLFGDNLKTKNSILSLFISCE